jgi:hypothetical protein
MIEDMLKYQIHAPRGQSFFELRASVLDEEARQCYRRMASDIRTVASAASPARADGVRLALLYALSAKPAIRTVFWRQVYRKTRTLLESADVAAHAGDPAFAAAYGRLLEFLADNGDLALTWPAFDSGRHVEAET